MSWTSWGLDIVSAAASSVGLGTGFASEHVAFGSLRVATTALLAEGGYSYVYAAHDVKDTTKVYAAKKVLAQDDETRAIAEVESRLLEALDGHAAFVRCHGTTSRPAAGGGAE